MDSKKQTFKFDWKMNKERIVFLFCAGLLLFILSLPNGDKKKDEKPPAEPEDAQQTLSGGRTVTSQEESYEKQLEERVREILSHVDGVGTVDVMIVLKSTEEKVLRVDRTTSSALTEEGENGGKRTVTSSELSEDTVLAGSGEGSGPIVEKELKPELSGIVISADGGGSAVVKAEISEAMEALFGLPPHKIKVLRRAG